MKLLVIITRMYEYGNGDEFKKWSCDNEIHESGNFGFLCIHGRDYTGRIESEEGGEKKITKNILAIIQERIGKLKVNQIGIIFHHHFAANIKSEDDILRQWGEFVETFKKKKGKKINNISISFVENYSGVMKENIYKGIKKLCTEKEEANNELIQTLWKYFSEEKKSEENVKLFSLLKHQIAHLLLPMDIDLQGIKEVLSSEFKVQSSKGEKEREAVDYLKDTLRDKSSKYYRQKLVDLGYLVTGKKQLDVEGIKTKLTEDRLAERKTILELIPEDKKEKVGRETEQLLELCGVNISENTVDKASLIYKFMELMDKRQKEEEKLKAIEQFNWVKYTSFHSWFCALDECLNKLKEELTEKP